mgnify:CR=1 FL=1
MKSVGEAMSIGRSFAESLQKGLRSMETGLNGLNEVVISGVKDPALTANTTTFRDAVTAALAVSSPERLLVIAQALRVGFSTEDIQKPTGYDPWFIEQIRAAVGAVTDLPIEQVKVERIRTRRGFHRNGNVHQPEADGAFPDDARHDALPESIRLMQTSALRRWRRQVAEVGEITQSRLVRVPPQGRRQEPSQCLLRKCRDPYPDHLRQLLGRATTDVHHLHRVGGLGAYVHAAGPESASPRAVHHALKWEPSSVLLLAKR